MIKDVLKRGITAETKTKENLKIHEDTYVKCSKYIDGSPEWAAKETEGIQTVEMGKISWMLTCNNKKVMGRIEERTPIYIIGKSQGKWTGVRQRGDSQL